MTIVYAQEQSLSAEEYAAVVGSTYMRDRRPVANLERTRRILAGSNMIVTAREASGGIVGVLRGISDGEWVCYVADLAVRDGHQRKGIGTGMLDACKRILGPGMGIVLVAYPEAVDYYRKIGMGEMLAFYIDREIRT
ncbi:MAG: GNAT family N-acetyltransferase [Devosia sp.]